MHSLKSVLRDLQSASRALLTGIGTLPQDLRFALRPLGKSPGFVIGAVLTLTLVMDANPAILSVVSLVVGDGLNLVLLGVAVGAVASCGAGMLLAAQLDAPPNPGPDRVHKGRLADTLAARPLGQSRRPRRPRRNTPCRVILISQTAFP